MSIPASPIEPWIAYDYAIIRLVPKVHLGFFLNIGVVLHSRTAGFLDARFRLDPVEIARFAPAIDLPTLARLAEAYRLICAGGPDGGPIGALPISERFHWLTSPRSTALQTSRVHPGRCHDPAEALTSLFEEQCGEMKGARA
jgi:hypothetical protein